MITGLVVWLVPLGWEWQGVMFAVLTLLAAWLWWKWLARRVREQNRLTVTLINAGNSW